MCGIVGVRAFDGGVDEGVLRAMQSSLEHRGPDEDGSWRSDGLWLGHRRLSIIDVQGSHQPMVAPGDEAVICFNGEIFNYREVRSQLSHPFQTHGDTEVLLAAYLRWGPEHVRRVEGQFAYAIFDSRTEDLWLFRDRVGVLPLYYYQAPGLFGFASEVKALLPLIGQRLSVDEASLGDYLTHRSVPAPDTLFADVKKVRAGHHLRVDREGRVHEVPYWQVPDHSPGHVAPHEAVERVDSALRASVSRALTADVPVGAYLSGGVDSSLITAMMRQVSPGTDLLTFAAAFEDSPDDERRYARLVSEHIGSKHHEVLVAASDFESLWSRLTYQRDAPLSEPADIAVFRLAEMARREVKVVLSGEGSDELFAGYPKYAAARTVERAATALPPALRQRLAELGAASLPRRMKRLQVPLHVLAERTSAERVQAWFSPFSSQERSRLLPSREARRVPHRIWSTASGDVVQRMLFSDAHAWLSDNLLERGDRMSMAASLELRPPFLDRELIELAFSLPTSVKIRNGQSKWVVKEVARRYLPASIVDRPKVGFRVPLDQWFRGVLRPYAHDMLLSPSSWVPQVLDRAAVAKVLSSHQSGGARAEMQIWTLLSLEVWHRTFFAEGGRGTYLTGL